uniref:DM13 domain-containing protein n=1 Tax=Ditylenchus dipsaci TaxID=166011 RepID=A0A915D5Y7_9BILA
MAAKILLILVVLVGLANLVVTQSGEGDEGDTYFGTPLGALHFSSDGTSAEIYAADEFTIIFNHFYHNPKQAGCTAMMLGPARNEDKENVIEGHGLLLAPAHPPVTAARHRLRRQAEDDQLTSRIEQFRSWPVEFDHLLMEPGHTETKTAAVSPTVSRTENSFDKLHLNQAEPQIHQQPAGSVHLKNVSKNESSSSLPALHNQSSTVVSNSSATHASTTLTTSTTTTHIQDRGSSQATIKPLILLSSKNHVSNNPRHNLRRVQPGVVADVTSVDDANLGVVVTSSGETYAINSKSTSVLGGQEHEVEQKSVITPISNSEGIRRAPIRGAEPLNPGNSREDTKWLSINSEKGTLAPSATTTTPLFWVIKDPRESRRQRLLELRRKVAQPEEITTTTTTEQTPITRFDERFELPRIRDKLATFSLTNGAKINQYKWIGLYDQCLRRHIPLVTLRDVDPPREEKIMPLSGWSHNYPASLMMLKILPPVDFTLNNLNSRFTKRFLDTYFFVGIGEFPNNIERQVKVAVVGNKKNEPLREYNGEDVLLRLPRGYRTFDIDFISVYNTDEQKSFGHVLIPSLLVPPCSED